MTRIFSDYAYGPGPRTGCWWDETISAPDWPTPDGFLKADVAVIGGGFTGMSAALHLAEAGVDVVVLDAVAPGWGASGRNGGFCCLGGSKIDAGTLVRRAGMDAAVAYVQAEVDAVTLVDALVTRFGLEVDRHSHGETQMAHKPSAFDALKRRADGVAQAYDVTPVLYDKNDLADAGMSGPFHGALTTPIGFGLNPRKYLFGLAQSAMDAGARVFSGAHVRQIDRVRTGFHLDLEDAKVEAGIVLIATNGYSSEDLPGMAGRYMPAQSNVLVTRPLDEAELAAQGWTTSQMAYDTRWLLHYFRLMPDRRFLFGLRGGLTSTPRAEARARRRARRDFEHMFPAWAHVESANAWSGMVCLSRNQVPFAGPIPDEPGVFAGFAYHGNGVAMATYTGRALARLALGQDTGLPSPMTDPPGAFPFGRLRRIVLPPAYLSFWLRDKLL